MWIAVDSVDRFAAEADQMAAVAAEHDLPALERAAQAMRLLADAHPDVFPHLCLHSIATVPEHRGRGAGAAVLSEPLGFTLEGEPIALPEGGPALAPMWRR
ncbi:hypothetical protein GCM10027447_20590 [Glycomyces halotolerans]